MVSGSNGNLFVKLMKCAGNYRVLLTHKDDKSLNRSLRDASGPGPLTSQTTLGNVSAQAL